MIRRYEDPQIQEIWSPTAVYQRWFEVELAALHGVDPELFILADEIGPPKTAQVTYHEQRLGHDVAAFLQAWDDRILTHARKIGALESEGIARLRSAMHAGLTSSDIVDTALAMGIRDSGRVLESSWEALHEAFGRLLRETQGKVTIARTHGQFAIGMSAQHRWSVLHAMLGRSWNRVVGALEGTEVGKLSGPAGTLFHDSEYAALNQLDLQTTRCTQLVPRDFLAYLAHCMAEFATGVEAVVTQVWLLAQQEVGELTLGRNVTTSSAMPHKRNPIACETVRGLARLARSQAEVLQLGIVQWGEHDMAHSSVERVALPDLFHLLCTMLRRTAEVVSGLEWHEPKLPPDYRDTSAVLRATQASGVPYVEAHAAIRNGLTSVVSSAPTTATNEEC